MRANRPQAGRKGATKTKPAYPGLYIKCAYAHFVYIAAISNRQVFFPNWDAPGTSLSQLTSSIYRLITINLTVRELLKDAINS